MPFEDVRSHFEDILESLNSIASFVADVDFESFREDEKTRAAVERKLLVISEAAIRLKENGERLCPGIHGEIFVVLGTGCAIGMTG